MGAGASTNPAAADSPSAVDTNQDQTISVSEVEAALKKEGLEHWSEQRAKSLHVALGADEDGVLKASVFVKALSELDGAARKLLDDKQTKDDETPKELAARPEAIRMLELKEHAALRPLAATDDRLVAALAAGAIKIVHADYLRHTAVGDRILRRQDLEALEKRGVRVFLSPEEAVASLRANGRVIGAFTYGWISPGDPDVGGAYLVAVRRFLCSELGQHLLAVFWECARGVMRPRRSHSAWMRSPHTPLPSPARFA